VRRAVFRFAGGKGQGRPSLIRKIEPHGDHRGMVGSRLLASDRNVIEHVVQTRCLAQLLTEVTAEKGTDNAPSCRLTLLFDVVTPVAVPTTVNGSAVAAAPGPPPLTTTV